MYWKIDNRALLSIFHVELVNENIKLVPQNRFKLLLCNLFVGLQRVAIWVIKMAANVAASWNWGFIFIGFNNETMQIAHISFQNFVV